MAWAFEWAGAETELETEIQFLDARNGATPAAARARLLLLLSRAARAVRAGVRKRRETGVAEDGAHQRAAERTRTEARCCTTN